MSKPEVIKCQCGCRICKRAALWEGVAAMRCSRDATQEDLLCDQCRPECITIHWQHSMVMMGSRNV